MITHRLFLPRCTFQGLVLCFALFRVVTLCEAADASASSKPGENQMNTLTPAEKAAGWRLLWDGVTTNGWHSAKGGEFPKSGWVINHGALTVLPSKEAHDATAGGDIITDQRYSNFELTAEFKTTPGANSGIKIFVQPKLAPIPTPNEAAAAGTPIGMEFQIIDDDVHPDAKAGRDGNRKTGSLYDLIPAPAKKTLLPVGSWNQVRIVAQGKHVEFWLNGAQTVVFERGSADFRRRVSESKFQRFPGFGEWLDGHILLQDHASEVSFCNLKIRELPSKD